MSHPNAQLVREGYEAIARGDLHGLAERLSDAAVARMLRRGFRADLANLQRILEADARAAA